MLIDFKEVLEKHGIEPRGVIHVGMHKAEEYPIYKELGMENILFVEANRDLAHGTVIDDDDCYIVHAAVSDIEEVVEFTVTNNGESSSILPLKDHSEIYPFIVSVEKIKMKTTTLDKVIQAVGIYTFNWNILNLDIQGAELKAMRGLTDWEHIELVYTEVNYREMYEGCALIGEVDEFLASKGFIKIDEHDTGCGWGDAVYKKL